jgi:predicted DNA-binding protein (UPF0251 family)
MRPKKKRRICCYPEERMFKPRGIPARELGVVRLEPDELEALRLADVEGLHHEAGGAHMGISRATFGRILEKARRKAASALLDGKAILLVNGDGGGA